MGKTKLRIGSVEDIKCSIGTGSTNADIPALEDRGIIRISTGDIHIKTGCGGRAAGVARNVEVEADRVDRAAGCSCSGNIKVEAGEGICAGRDDACIRHVEFQSFGACSRRIGRRSDDIKDGRWRCGTDADIAGEVVHVIRTGLINTVVGRRLYVFYKKTIPGGN